MGRAAYEQDMKQRLRDLGLQIESVRARLGRSGDPRLTAALATQLEFLADRRRGVSEKLAALRDEPDGTWDDLKAEVDDAWDALVQEFEESVASLA